jgi:phage head maturation protease
LDRSNPVHQTVYSAIKRGDVDGCSFAFTVPEGGDTWEENGGTILRTLKRVKLFELGPVLWPAYPAGTSVGARAERRSDYLLRNTDNWRARAIAKLHRIDTEYQRQRCAAIGRQIAAEKDKE